MRSILVMAGRPQLKLISATFFYAYPILITNKHCRTLAIIIALTMSSPELPFILWG